MASSLADSPPSQERNPQDAAQQGAGASPGEPPAQQPGAAMPQAGPACTSCGSAMAPGQDWCMHCGAGAPGSVETGAWRPWALALVVTTVLVLVAAAAGYAALSKSPKHAAVKTTTVAQAPPPVATTPPATTPTPTPPPVATTKLPKVKVPNIPTTAVTPPVTTPSTPASGTGGTNEQKPSTTGTGGSGSGAKPEPILLDTDAAATYNPYAYPTTGFGDPSLTIDGDPSTGWSAGVNPETAPRMAEGVVIDLKSSKKLSAVKLVTTTPGMTLQIYGAKATTLPASITDSAWTPLSGSLALKKRHAKIGLKHKDKAFRFVTVWISAAPGSSTPENPGRVTLNEIELFPVG